MLRYLMILTGALSAACAAVTVASTVKASAELFSSTPVLHDWRVVMTLGVNDDYRHLTLDRNLTLHDCLGITRDHASYVDPVGSSTVKVSYSCDR